jgi:hypothetical protein
MSDNTPNTAAKLENSAMSKDYSGGVGFLKILSRFFAALAISNLVFWVYALECEKAEYPYGTNGPTEFTIMIIACVVGLIINAVLLVTFYGLFYATNSGLRKPVSSNILDGWGIATTVLSLIVFGIGYTSWQ